MGLGENWDFAIAKSLFSYLYKIQLFDFTLQIWMRISILATKMQIDIYIYTDVKS